MDQIFKEKQKYSRIIFCLLFSLIFFIFLPITYAPHAETILIQNSGVNIYQGEMDTLNQRPEGKGLFISTYQGRQINYEAYWHAGFIKKIKKLSMDNHVYKTGSFILTKKPLSMKQKGIFYIELKVEEKIKKEKMITYIFLDYRGFIWIRSWWPMKYEEASSYCQGLGATLPEEKDFTPIFGGNENISIREMLGLYAQGFWIAKVKDYVFNGSRGGYTYEDELSEAFKNVASVFCLKKL